MLPRGGLQPERVGGVPPLTNSVMTPKSSARRSCWTTGMVWLPTVTEAIPNGHRPSLDAPAQPRFELRACTVGYSQGEMRGAAPHITGTTTARRASRRFYFTT